ADDGEVALVVDLREVAGAVPALLEHGRGRLGIAEVAVEEHRAARQELAVAGVDAHLLVLAGHAAASRLAGDVWVLEGGDVARLGGAVEDPHPRVRERRLDRLQERERRGRRTAVREPDR